MSDWFIEKDANELSFGYSVNKTLFEGKSPFQEVKVYETKAYGKMLVIDGFVMLTETDEFVYHEMISHIPMSYHKDPKDILVIGGGDGGTVRELVKYKGVESVTLCEIDKLVVDVSRKFFPKVAGELDHKKVTVKIGDGIDYVKNQENKFDVVLVDSTDPIGPGEALFTKEFYQGVAKALKPGGIVALQSESPWYEAKILNRIQENVSSAFPIVKPYVAPIPTYPRGLWSWTMASHSEENFVKPNLDRFAEVKEGMKYLTPSQVTNVFDIPPFLKEKLKK